MGWGYENRVEIIRRPERETAESLAWLRMVEMLAEHYRSLAELMEMYQPIPPAEGEPLVYEPGDDLAGWDEDGEGPGGWVADPDQGDEDGPDGREDGPDGSDAGGRGGDVSSPSDRA